MKYIGGYFELESQGPSFKQHQPGYALASGRSSLRQILLVERPALVHVPYYSCKELISPIRQLGIPLRFYRIGNAFEPLVGPLFESDEWIVAVNFFGICTRYINDLVSRFGTRVIIDNSQAVFATSSHNNWSFNSIRKWFGIPDGSILTGPRDLNIQFEDTEYQTPEYLYLRRQGRQQEGYQSFLNFEQSIDSRIRPMSKFAAQLWRTIDFDFFAKQRRCNYSRYHDALGSFNLLSIEPCDQEVPFFYPFLPSVVLDRKILSQQGIFIPTFWSDVLERPGPEFLLEKTMSERLLPLPVDHRYSSIAVDSVVTTIKALLIKTLK